MTRRSLFKRFLGIPLALSVVSLLKSKPALSLGITEHAFMDIQALDKRVQGTAGKFDNLLTYHDYCSTFEWHL